MERDEGEAELISWPRSTVMMLLGLRKLGKWRVHMAGEMWLVNVALPISLQNQDDTRHYNVSLAGRCG